MNLLDRFTIKSRLWGASVLLLLLFLAFGLFSLYGMRALERLTWELYEHPFQVSNAALRASAAVSKMQSIGRQAILARSDSEIAVAVQESRNAERAAYENLEVVRTKILGAEGRQMERETRELVDSRIKFNREILQLVQQGNRAAAIALSLGPADVLTHRLEHRLLELRNYAGNKAKGFMDKAGERQRHIYQNTIMFLAVAALLAFLFGFFLIRSALSDLAALRGTMAAITRTGRLEKSTVAGANEIADMAAHFNGLMDRMQFQFWLKDGLAALTRELSGDLPADALSARGLNLISRYVGACAGAFYAYDQPGARWELKASYALGEGTCLAPQFKAGEGIVGQVAVERKPIFLTGITRDQAVALSGAVSEPPRSLYAFPLLYQGELTGVMEVASFAGLDAGQREFLDAMAHILAVSLYAAVQTDNNRGLLKASQKANEELAVMNEELQTQSEELQAQTEELQAQTEELQAQTEELERQRLRVEEADRLKSEFLSNMSHELRTPLNSVLALTQLMMARGTGKDAAQEAEYLQVIERNGRRLLHLINDILDIARIESGRVQLTLAEIDPGGTCARALETVRPLAAERGLELKAGCGGLPRICTDEDKLQQILINLLSNAVKFTDQGEIELAVEAAGDRVRFVVRDTGVGIAPEVLPSIFDKFRQADGSSTRRFEGTGLGLAICRSLAKFLGGEITVESLVGRGSTFTLTLPKTCPEPLDAADAAPVPRPSPATAPVQPRPAPAAARPGPPLILVVEDNRDNLLVITAVLEEAGYQYITATDGQKAVALAREAPPALILMDLQLPGLGGLEAARQIKADPLLAGTPIVALTAMAMRGDREEILAAGLDDYLAKPFDPQELMRLVRRWLG